MAPSQSMAILLAITLGVLTGCGDSSSGTPPQAAPLPTAAPADSPATSQATPAATAPATPSVAVIPPPIDLPAFASREELMKSMGGASRKVGSSNLDEARAAAVQIGEYSLAARHPRFEPQGPEYERLAIELWQANQQVQIAMGPNGNRATLQEALRTQRAACQTCHEVFRIEEP